jgi:NAD(P)H-dependent flavin oxidoreductase YrpB (nitropropane dioxygenase family)
MLYDHTQRLKSLLGIEFPIIQDGMGPFRTNHIAVAMVEAGGLGTVSIPGMTKPYDEAKRLMRANIDYVAERVNGPFAMNTPVGVDSHGVVFESSRAHIDALTEAREQNPLAARYATTIITSAGFPGAFRDQIRDSGLVHLAKIGATKHALKAEAAGVDGIIASGYEMGGHTHLNPVHTMVLVPNVTEAVSVPVIAAGGFRDGRGLAAALALGACGIAMGTRFIATPENDEWNPAYPQHVLSMKEGDDTVYPAVYGPARGLNNAGARRLREIIANHEMGDDELARWKDDQLIAAQQDGDMENGLVVMGQVGSGINEITPIAEIVRSIDADARRILSQPERDSH